jgi:ribonuclease P protein component
MSGPNTFPKTERLSHRKDVDRLFSEGLSFSLSPFKVYYLRDSSDMEIPVKVLVTVPRKKFKRAVDRNRLRRMIREAYRLNRSLLMEKAATIPGCLHVGFVYSGTRIDIPYRDIEQPVMRCLKRLGSFMGSIR